MLRTWQARTAQAKPFASRAQSPLGTLRECRRSCLAPVARDQHKGAALTELARVLEVSRENIFASGDHHNDISMLDGRVAAMLSCPANAIQEVQDAVRKADGYSPCLCHGRSPVYICAGSGRPRSDASLIRHFFPRNSRARLRGRLTGCWFIG